MSPSTRESYPPCEMKYLAKKEGKSEKEVQVQMKNDLGIPFSLPHPKPAAMLELAIHAIGFILINY